MLCEMMPVWMEVAILSVAAVAVIVWPVAMLWEVFRGVERRKGGGSQAGKEVRFQVWCECGRGPFTLVGDQQLECPWCGEPL